MARGKRQSQSWTWTGGPSKERTVREKKPEEQEPESLEGILYSWAQALIVAVVGVVLLFTFGVRLIGVSGPSMQDTLYTGDRLVVLSNLFGGYKRGDVVVVNAYNAELSETIVKRIVATGGQTVDIDFVSGTVYVDGEALEEPYIKEPTYSMEGLTFPVTLAEDEVFIMGDNRNSSTDSRSTMLGPVNEGYIQGKALFLLTPGKTPDPTDPTNPDKGERDWSRVGFIK